MAAERGLSPVIGTVLLVAIVVVLSGVVATIVTGVTNEPETTTASIDVSVDAERNVLIVTHEGGEPVALDGERDLVLVTDERSIPLDPLVDGDTFRGESVSIPLETAGVGVGANVVYRKGGDDPDQTMMAKSVPEVEGVQTAWQSPAGGAGHTRTWGLSADPDDPFLDIAASASAVGPGGRVFHQDGGTFKAMDPSDESVRWTVDNAPTSNPVVLDGVVYAVFLDGVDPYLRGYDTENGELVFEEDISIQHSNLATDGDRLYGARGAKIVAYAVDDGSTVWQRSLGSTLNTPTVADGTVVVNNGGTTWALDAEDGTTQWTKSIGNSFTSPAIADGTVYFKDGTDVVAASLADGSEQWRTGVGDAVVGSPAVRDGTVYVADANSELAALDAGSGTVEWTTTVVSGSGPGFDSQTRLTVASETVYVGGSTGYSRGVFALDRSDGSLRWSKTTSSSWYTPTVYPIDGRLVLVKG
jgi:flagellin-like protein